MASTTAASRTDVSSREIKASPEAVFRAFVDPAALISWLPPKGMAGEVFEFDPREGGAYRIELKHLTAKGAAAAKSSETSDFVQGRFLSIIPDRKIVQSAVFDSSDPSFAGEMVMTWTFMPTATGTEVRIVASNVPSGISREDHDAGLRSTLENLAAFVE